VDGDATTESAPANTRTGARAEAPQVGALRYGRAVADRARQAVELTVGLAVLGVQRWMTVRGDVEAELERLGLGPAAELSRRVGDVVTQQLGLLTGDRPAS
jgi:hypothetical protein